MRTSLALILTLFATLAGGVNSFGVIVDFTNVPHTKSRMTFNGTTDTFTFGIADSGIFNGFGFQINGSDSAGKEAIGLLGVIDGTFTIGPITSGPGFEEATVTSSVGAAIRIQDEDGIWFTGKIDWLSLFMSGTSGFMNMNGVVNLTDISYAGTNPDLIALKGASSTASAVLTFTFLPSRTLTQLTTDGAVNLTSYTGDIVSVPCVGEIGDYVWADLNGNGCQNLGEPGIPGVEVKLYKGCGDAAVLVQTTTTDASGKYLFSGLCAGDYSIEFTTPAGYIRTVANSDLCSVVPGGSDEFDSDCDCQGTTCRVCVTLPTGSASNLTIDCGYIPLAAIGDRVWVDLNGNGLQDGSEVGLPGVAVDLYTCADTLMASTLTDANGLYAFIDLVPGDYYVKFTLPNGYVFTRQNEGLNDAIDSDADITTGAAACTTLSAGENDVTWDAGVIPLSSICGYVYHDVNDNGILEPGEPAISGVTVTLTGTTILGVPVNAVTVTDGTGRYCFNDLVPGTYTVTETQPAAYLDGKDTQGTPGTGTTLNDQFLAVILGPNVHGDNNNFGELTPPEEHGGCRTTGGGRQAISWPPVEYVTHGGQVGAPVGDETHFAPDTPCIQGNWEHVRHEKGGTRGNFHAKSFDSLICACLGCPEDPNAPVTINGLCNPGARTCGPEPRKAPANKITFSGVGDYATEKGKRETRSVLFRVDLEDRSEPGNSHAKGSQAPHDRHRIRIWILTDAELAKLNDPNDRLLAFRQAIAASPSNVILKDGAIDGSGQPVANGTAVFGVRAPDIDDGGEMTHGNHQLHPSIKPCD